MFPDRAASPAPQPFHSSKRGARLTLLCASLALAYPLALHAAGEPADAAVAAEAASAVPAESASPAETTLQTVTVTGASDNNTETPVRSPAARPP